MVVLNTETQTWEPMMTMPETMVYYTWPSSCVMMDVGYGGKLALQEGEGTWGKVEWCHQVMVARNFDVNKCVAVMV
ncbi:BnaC03g16820D [Brassica napus]|uniref:BnaC03g16820D protein n=1 Tax=Brassica napus TaxID=3708 RepID=A0A078GF80_BRANA|nr:BnaC03g16820D [Brassica napus]